MKAFYASLKARGKASKLALIAVARKILVLANALIRTMTPYQAPANSVLLKKHLTRNIVLRVRLTATLGLLPPDDNQTAPRRSACSTPWTV